jgi:hypothetical protein
MNYLVNCFRCKHFTAREYSVADGSYHCLTRDHKNIMDNRRAPAYIVTSGYCGSYREISIKKMPSEQKIYYYTGVIYK